MSQSSFLKSLLFAGAASLALAACGEKADSNADADGDAPSVTHEENHDADTGSDVDYAAVYTAAIDHPDRPDADRNDDARRKPALGLAFFEVAPGMTVFEVEAGGGWYTELISRVVGPDGVVIMQNPEGILQFVGDDIEKRLEGDRLANVRQSVTNFDALDAKDATVDLVTWILGPHELYFKPEEGSTLGDPAGAFAEVARVLKTGGVFVVIDHSAEDGAPETTGNDLHRIDKAIVKRLAEEAGLVFDGQSDFLVNPEDPLTISVFDQAIRGRTSQFAIRFTKPE